MQKITEGLKEKHLVNGNTMKYYDLQDRNTVNLVPSDVTHNKTQVRLFFYYFYDK